LPEGRAKWEDLVYFLLALMAIFSFVTCNKKDVSSVSDTVNNKKDIAAAAANDNS
jgi:hypothetical protein